MSTAHDPFASPEDLDAVEEAVEAELAEDHGIIAQPTDAITTVSRFDDAVDAWFDRNLRGRPPVDRALYTVTELADFSLLWHLIAAWEGVASPRGPARFVRMSALLAVEQTLVNGVLKSLFKRSRPVPDFERPHHLRVPLTTSFPSGHASAAFFAATMLADESERGAAWYALAGLVAASRVHVKIHHASDVLAGAATGLVLGRLARRLWP